MDRQQIGLKLAIDALGHELDLTSFDCRLVLQKSICLAQAAGVDLGYTFSWYLKGPYSSGLTRDAFAIRAASAGQADDLRGWALDATSLERLGRLRQLIESIPPAERARRLELLASVQFLLRTRQATVADVPGLRQTLIQSNKDFPEPDIRSAIEVLSSNGLLPAGQR